MQQNLNANYLELNEDTPEEIKYFFYGNTKNKHSLDHSLPNANEIMSSILDYEIMSIRILEDRKSTLINKKILNGKRALIDINFKEKVMYMSDNKKKSLNIIESSFYRTVSILLPNKISASEIIKLKQKTKLRTNIQIEHKSLSIENKRVFITCLNFFVEICL